MAIKINTLNLSNTEGHTFCDIKLDLEAAKKDGGKPLPKNITESNDIVTDYDTSAIRNSIVNLLTTKPGQRPLSLGFGINLQKFIGEQITTTTANAIASEIKRGIESWEPRVKLNQIAIYPNADEMMYEIIIDLHVPALDGRRLQLAGEIDSNSGMTFSEYR